MKDAKMLGLAIAIMSDAFKGKLDAQGLPYALHCLHVMNQVKSLKQKIRAVLHDFVEDIFKGRFEEGFAFLRAQGFDEDDIRVIRILTHNPEDDYFNVYIKGISLDNDATEIKIADLRHNSDLLRIKGALSKAHFDRMELYHRSFHYLYKK